MFDIAGFDYNHELNLLRDKYQKLDSLSTIQGYDSVSKPKSLIKISPSNANGKSMKTNQSKNFESICASSNSNSNRSLPHIRQNSSSVVLDSINEDCRYEAGNNVASLNNIPNSNSRMELPKAMEGNQYQGSYTSIINTVPKRLCETTKNIKKIMYEGEDSTYDNSEANNPTSINCRFKTHH